MASSSDLALLKELDDLNTLEKEVNQALQCASKGTLTPPKPISLASLPLPQTPLTEKATAYAKSWLDSIVFVHSMRAYYLGSAIATANFPHWNWDPEMFYLASMLHDLGFTSVAMKQTPLSFEFHGGVLAREFLLREGAPARLSDNVAEAVIRHRDNICAQISSDRGSVSVRPLRRIRKFLFSLLVDVGLLITCHVCHPCRYLRHQSVTRFCPPIDPWSEEEVLVPEFKKGKKTELCTFRVLQIWGSEFLYQ